MHFRLSFITSSSEHVGVLSPFNPASAVTNAYTHNFTRRRFTAPLPPDNRLNMVANDIEAANPVYYDAKKQPGSGRSYLGAILTAVDIEEAKDANGGGMVEPGLHRGLKDRHSESNRCRAPVQR